MPDSGTLSPPPPPPERVTVDGIEYVRAYNVAPGKCEACGFARGVWTAPLVIHAIQHWNQAYGRPPKAAEWRGGAKPDRPTLTTVLDLFGTWNRAIEAAGFTPRRAGGNRRWNRDSILAAFGEWARTHKGHPPTCEEWEIASPGHPGASTVVRHFGSWNAAIDAAGFFPRTSWGSRVRPRLPKSPEPVGLVHAEPVAEVLRREVAARSLESVAAELGVDGTYVSRIMRGLLPRIRADYADRILTLLDRPDLLDAARVAA